MPAYQVLAPKFKPSYHHKKEYFPGSLRLTNIGEKCTLKKKKKDFLRKGNEKWDS
jgi:hypothetical protein